MYQFEITANEAGQRFDKYLHKLLPKAPTSFFYKMLRKKNIVLNHKKAEGKEKLAVGDCVSLYLSEETYQSFQERKITGEYITAYQRLKGIYVVYENQHMLLLNKPAGILSQKAQNTDLSANEWLIGYLLEKEIITEDSLSTYKPSVCNRLDRNTSGLIICAKTLAGSQELNRLIASRQIRKFYRLFVKGSMCREMILDGYLLKNKETNKVTVFPTKDKTQIPNEASYIRTSYHPIQTLSDFTYLEVELFTGKTHQIRAHMASIGHPLLGDYKYGNKSWNDYYHNNYGIKSQLLHAYRLEFPKNDLLFPDKNMIFTAEEPAVFKKILNQSFH